MATDYNPQQVTGIPMDTEVPEASTSGPPRIRPSPPCNSMDQTFQQFLNHPIDNNESLLDKIGNVSAATEQLMDMMKELQELRSRRRSRSPARRPRSPSPFHPGTNPITGRFYESHPVPHHTVKDVKGAKIPDAFQGVPEDARPFIQRMEALFTLQPFQYRMTKTRVLTTCQLMTKGSAKSWATSVMEAVSSLLQNAFYFDSWKIFTEAFLHSFGIPNEKEMAINKLQVIKQGKMTIDQYITEFAGLQALSGLADAAVVHNYKKGLNPRIFFAVYRIDNPPNNLGDWVTKSREKSRQMEEMEAFNAMQRHGGNFHFNSPSWNKPKDPNAMDIDRMHHKPSSRGGNPTSGKGKAKPHVRPTAAEERRRKEKGLCFRCGQKGHFRPQCKATFDQLSPQQIRNIVEAHFTRCDAAEGAEDINVFYENPSITGGYEEDPENDFSIPDSDEESDETVIPSGSGSSF